MLLGLMAGLLFGSLLVAWLVCTVAMTEGGQRKGGWCGFCVQRLEPRWVACCRCSTARYGATNPNLLLPCLFVEGQT